MLNELQELFRQMEMSKKSHGRFDHKNFIKAIKKQNVIFDNDDHHEDDATMLMTMELTMALMMKIAMLMIIWIRRSSYDDDDDDGDGHDVDHLLW